MARPSEDERESRRILARIAGETDPGGASFAGRALRRARRHLAADDADQDDAIEVWGTRIGRTVGLVVTVLLVAYLLSLFLGR